jgi:2-polyprenyl-3-methyl-5-hydroxy-6-metoxy-1,4-benzoquinol methylase
MENKFLISHIQNTECLACGTSDLRSILDLGKQPLANNYHNGETQDEYPLNLNLCQSCYHLQLSHTVNPDLMFKNYLYVSGTAKTLRDYFDYFASKTLEYLPKATKILDIACNDGTQLDSYLKLGLQTYGIDPAENLYEDSKLRGHNIICDYFNSDTSHKFEGKTFDIITAQNVFAHTSYTVDFLNTCKEVMDDDSLLFIQTSQANMVRNNEFDTIYHEHLSFFSSNSMKSLVERCGMTLYDIFKTDIHGTSYVFVISKSKKEPKDGVSKNLLEEKELGMTDVLTYPEYALKCYQSTFNLKKKLEEMKNEGYILVGYGAAAKGNTLLNFGKISLDFIIDDNPLKQNLLTPGMNIPIFGPEKINQISENDKVVFVPLAWNFYSEIRNRITERRKNDNDFFVRYFPTLFLEK